MSSLDAEYLSGHRFPYQEDIALVDDIDLVAATPGDDINWLEDVELLVEDGLPAVFDRYSNSFLKLYFDIPEGRENEIARKLTNNGKWIGAYENVAATVPGTGNYEWLTGEPFTFTNWAPQQPDSMATHCATGQFTRCYEHCVVVLGDGTWADHVCDIADGYVCEWDPAGAK